MRTARANSVPLSTIRTGRSPRRWLLADRLLAVALTEYEDGLCSGCGQPRDRAWNDDMVGMYEPHTGTCAACLAMAEHEELHKRGPGEHRYVSDSQPAFVPDDRMLAID